LASLIVTATTSGAAGSSALLNQLVQAQDAPIEVTETYTVESPKTEAGAKIFQQVLAASKRHGLHPDSVLRVASCESNFRQYNAETGKVLRGRVNGADVGVFQINEKYHLIQSQKLGFNIYEAEGNIEYAMWLMKKEGNRHWNWSKPCWGSERELKN